MTDRDEARKRINEKERQTETNRQKGKNLKERQKASQRVRKCEKQFKISGHN